MCTIHITTAKKLTGVIEEEAPFLISEYGPSPYGGEDAVLNQNRPLELRKKDAIWV